MKKITKLLCLLLVVMLVSGCSASNRETKEQSQWETIYDAYVYTFPLVLVNATMEKMTNTVEPTTTQAPVNQLFHSHNLANASAKDVVTLNTDTLYSQAFLDLSETAMVFVMPKADRFCSGEIMDGFTNAVKITGSGSDNSDQTAFLITGPNYSGEIPNNLTQVAMPTNMTWILCRVLSYGEADLANVYAIQNKMQLLPLANYLSGEAYIPAKGSYDESENFIPIEHVLQMSPAEFFNTANQLMVANPPVNADQAMIEKISAVGVGPGLKFDEAILGDSGQEDWTEMINSLSTTLFNDSQDFLVQMNNWRFFGEPVAEFGTEYDYRALIALNGLAANPVSVAIYPNTNTDSDGVTFDGTNNYVIHFDKDQLPPTKDTGFWSITAYDSNNFLIDNPINRYSINDRSTVTYNQDGSLDLLLQTQAPADATMANNWLPISADNFHLYLRIYLPQESVLNGTWQPPTIKKAE
ncbi:DUF1254 domain-containing protein [Acetobacterium sp.]|jgi:hypothetical protein|uniref:DUF1254 domain-containing protein n=1 Tax=Acetobacterium sp. TaxID=1872094 RepID=UPI000CAD8219|nr:DUF1254 domain-containing protein [Acetobacterium sp.]MDO9491836.1 DUF1214 domain-containing protein [Acetobacterium sp.]PKM74908.1 MAG: hypothetical protein CVU92_04115 [Firmicutes bacterium HGW-Firmicutes-17]